MKAEASLPFVVVVWDDAHSTAAEPYTVDDIPHRPLKMETRGWLLRDDAEGVSLAPEKYTSDDVTYYRGHTFIPRGMVRTTDPVVSPRKRTHKPKALKADFSDLQQTP